MSTKGQFNTKNPTIKRILKEASELASHASADYHAEPLEDNLFEWHFTLRGPPAPSPYASGLYHGRIILPAQYPLRPPSFRFVTPTGRFEVNREICLSISGHHEETWQPAWGIRTALVAIRSFMDTDAKGQVGGIDSTEAARRKMAAESAGYKCAACGGRSNAEIMREREELARRAEEEAGGKREEEEAVPEELRLAYREDLAKEEGAEAGASSSSSAAAPDKTEEGRAKAEMPAAAAAPPPVAAPAAQPPAAAPRLAPVAPAVPTPTRTIPAAPLQQQQLQQRTDDGVPAWIDKAIYGIAAMLAFMILRKLF